MNLFAQWGVHRFWAFVICTPLGIVLMVTRHEDLALPILIGGVLFLIIAPAFAPLFEPLLERNRPTGTRLHHDKQNIDKPEDCFNYPYCMYCEPVPESERATWTLR